MAPGVDIDSSYLRGTYRKQDGTSMSSPHIAAVAAMFKIEDPSLTPVEIEDKIKKTTEDLGDEGWDKYYGYGVPKLSKATVDVPLESLTLSEKEITLSKGEEFVLKALYNPSNATGAENVIWNTSDGNVATVDGNGKVTAIGSGQATITVEIKGKTATCVVKVEELDVVPDSGTDNNKPGEGTEDKPTPPNGDEDQIPYNGTEQEPEEAPEQKPGEGIEDEPKPPSGDEEQIPGNDTEQKPEETPEQKPGEGTEDKPKPPSGDGEQTPGNGTEQEPEEIPEQKPDEDTDNTVIENQVVNADKQGEVIFNLNKPTNIVISSSKLQNRDVEYILINGIKVTRTEIIRKNVRSIYKLRQKEYFTVQNGSIVLSHQLFEELNLDNNTQYNAGVGFTDRE